ncbi:hypothetical protein AVEN_121017-1 [Araneus ventricosus]|uniref:H15 domain-containing protein n=1 Tax=Araneus ventricosus TaxID=182803 RepID=A0A4Y2UQZ6_ARAVE|nr:hypothetical protein AVEN_121017-1 [Araneus ventricosus]
MIQTVGEDSRLQDVRRNCRCCCTPPPPRLRKGKSGAAKSATLQLIRRFRMSKVNHHSEREVVLLSGYQKYISSEYKVDIDRLTPFIRKYLKSAVAAGTLVQTKGKEPTVHSS